MNELITQKNWFKRNWKWLITSLTVMLLFLGLLSTSKLGGNIVGIAKVYSESEVCDNALEIARKDTKVIQLLGELEGLKKLAILEGSHKYSNNYNSLNITVDVSGSKEIKGIRCKMDILAERNGNDWKYKSIKIRIKKPEDLKQTIVIGN